MAEQTRIERPKCFTKDDLKAHIRAIGESIIEISETMNIDPHLTKEIRIHGEIAPLTEATTVSIEIIRFADPRVKMDKFVGGQVNEPRCYTLP